MPAIGSVMKSWWRVGTIGTRMPTSSASRADQAPAASTTTGLSITPADVRTPRIRPPSWRNPVTAVPGARVTPISPAAAANSRATSGGWK